MDTTTKTYREVLQFINLATHWQRRQSKDSPMSGFKYAISRVLKSASKVQEKYDDAQTDFNIDLATQDEKGNILTNKEGGTVFTKENSRKRNEEIRKLLDKPIEVGSYIAKTPPTDLTVFEINAFEGFVMLEITDPDAAKPE